MSRETKIKVKNHVLSIPYEGAPILDFVADRTSASMFIISHSCAMHRWRICRGIARAMPITSFALCAIVIVVLASTMKNARQ
jgi:hypothetical protein